MRLGGVAAHQQNSLGISDVVVAVGHRTVAPGVGDSGDGSGVTDARLVIGIVRSPEGGELAIEVSRLVCEFGRTEPVDRIRARLLADLQKFVADLSDGLVPRKPLPLAVHQLLRVAQAAVAQHVIADRRALAAM